MWVKEIAAQSPPSIFSEPVISPYGIPYTGPSISISLPSTPLPPRLYAMPQLPLPLPLQYENTPQPAPQNHRRQTLNVYNPYPINTAEYYNYEALYKLTLPISSALLEERPDLQRRYEEVLVVEREEEKSDNDDADADADAGGNGDDHDRFADKDEDTDDEYNMDWEWEDDGYEENEDVDAEGEEDADAEGEEDADAEGEDDLNNAISFVLYRSW